MMPRKGGKKKAKKVAPQGAGMIMGPPSGATSYHGPITPPIRTLDVDMVVVRLTATFGVSSTISGSIGQGYPNNPSTFTEWANFAAIYEEFRVLAAKYTFIPNYVNYVLSTSTNAQAPVVYTVQRDPSLSVPPTIATAFQSGNARIKSISQKDVFVVRAGTVQEMAFSTTALGGTTWQFSQTAQSLSVSSVYGVMFEELLVQFRCRS